MSIDYTKAQAIHERSLEILSTVGMRFLHPDAIDVLKKHGVKVEGDTAYFTEKEITDCLEMVPSQARIYARDPRYDMVLGDGTTYLGPMMGGINVLDPDGTKRPPLVEDVIKADKIVEYNPRFNVNGGMICMPSEIPGDKLMIFQIYSGLMLSAKVQPDFEGSYETMEKCYEIVMAAFGIDEEELKARPRILSGININSPLMLDKVMTETLFTNLKYRQPCYLAPAAMAGSTAPITMAGTIVQTNAEVLGALALAEMYAPGAPVLYGSQSACADMRSLLFAPGAPEAALCHRYAGIMGEFYGIPVRAGGLVSDAKKTDAQAGFEAMLNCFASIENNVSVALHAAGDLESYTTLSFEKMVSDFQAIDYADVYFRDIEINDETVPMDDIKACVPTGAYFAAKSTRKKLKTAILDPKISARGNAPYDGLEKKTADYIKKALDSYQAPELTAEQMAEMRGLVLEAGIDEAVVRKIEDARG